MLNFGTSKYALSAGRPPSIKKRSIISAIVFWLGKWDIALRISPEASPSCKRRATTESMAVPEITPSSPAIATCLANCHEETAIPMPP